jgi:hypothetical protein
MDLNLLYTQHQLSLMQAASASSCRLRARHLAAAGMVANRIGNYQRAKGATAASDWLRGIENPQSANTKGISA